MISKRNGQLNKRLLSLATAFGCDATPSPAASRDGSSGLQREAPDRDWSCVSTRAHQSERKVGGSQDPIQGISRHERPRDFAPRKSEPVRPMLEQGQGDPAVRRLAPRHAPRWQGCGRRCAQAADSQGYAGVAPGAIFVIKTGKASLLAVEKHGHSPRARRGL